MMRLDGTQQNVAVYQNRHHERSLSNVSVRRFGNTAILTAIIVSDICNKSSPNVSHSPRPLLLPSIRHDEMIRLKMRPGITSLAAVSGRQALTWDERMMLDRRYVENWSLWLDLRILWRTLPVALSQANVYDPDGEMKERS
jgi:hypothetical protein